MKSKNLKSKLSISRSVISNLQSEALKAGCGSRGCTQQSLQGGCGTGGPAPTGNSACCYK